jgi:DNA-binding NarL/FixJ family response regulator
MFDLPLAARADSLALHAPQDYSLFERPLQHSADSSRPSNAVVVIGALSPVMVCGLEALVRATSGARIAGSAQTLSALLDVCGQAGEAIALIDSALGHHGLAALMADLKAAAPRLRIVLMTDEHQPHMVREAVRLGASGLVGRAADAGEIRAALWAAAAGRRFIAPTMASHLAEVLALDELTQREAQVLGRLSRGHCNKIIARELDVTVGTIKTHVRAIMCKLDAHSRTEAVHKAYRLGLLCLTQ